MAWIFAVTPRTVRNWARTGTLNAVRVGGVTRYRADEIDRLIDSRNSGDPAANRAFAKSADAGDGHDEP